MSYYSYSNHNNNSNSNSNSQFSYSNSNQKYYSTKTNINSVSPSSISPLTSSMNNTNNINNMNMNNDNIRIIKRNLVYVINLDPQIADKELLLKKEYFGQYGKITKILVNLNKAYNSNNSSSNLSYSAYINYSTNQEAALAILAVDSCMLNGKILKAAFGTTKYCSYYLKKQCCPVKDCVYMHSVSDKNDIICKDSADFYVDQHKLAVKISNIADSKMKECLYKQKSSECILPSAYSIYNKKSISFYIKKEIKDRQKERNNENQTEGEENKDKIDADSPVKSSLNQLNYQFGGENSTNEKSNRDGDSSNSLHIQKEIDVKSESPTKKNKKNKEKPYDSTSTDNIKTQTKERSISYCLPINIDSSSNKRHYLFNVSNRPAESRFRFLTDVKESDKINLNLNEFDSDATADEKIIRDYFFKFSFSSAFKSKEKTSIELNYYKGLVKSDEYCNLIM